MVKALGSEIKKCLADVNGNKEFSGNALTYNENEMYYGHRIEELNDHDSYQLNYLGRFYYENGDNLTFGSVFKRWKDWKSQ